MGELIRDRVKAMRVVRAGDLVPSALNWREHPDNQRKAVQGSLEELGDYGAVLTRELPDGRLEILDGHLRRDLDPERMVRVLVTDLDEAEARKALLTHDPLAAMAEKNQEAFDSLARDVEIRTAALKKMVDEQIAGFSPAFQPVGIDEQGRLDEKKKVKCPECGHEFAP